MDDRLEDRFNKIIETNKHRVMRVCRVYSANPDDQKDMYQEVALNIWQSLPSFREESMIDTWVYRICLNVCIHYSMKLKKAHKYHSDIEGITISIQSEEHTSDAELSGRINKMYSCIAALNDQDKSLILLFLEDLPYKTISHITGITENHVAVKVRRIKKKII